MEVVARELRADAAFLRLPRSGNHHDLGLFGIGKGAAAAAARHRGAVPPRLAGRHDRRARAGPDDPRRAGRLHRRVQPRRDQERLRRRPGRQRVRGHVDAAPGGLGRVRERRARRPARPGRRGRALVRRRDRGPHGPRLGGARRRDDDVDGARRRHRRAAPTRPRRWSCCCTAAAPTSRHPRPGRPAAAPGPPYAAVRAPDRRGRRVRLVRQPRHRSPGRGVAPRDHGLVPRLARRASPPRAAPWC